MADKYFVYYRKLGYASAPYPVIHVALEDDTDYTPLEYLTVNGWTQTDYDWATFDTWNDADGETSHDEWYVTPGTTPTASTTSKDNLSLEQRQAIKQGEIDALIATAQQYINSDAKITVATRTAYATYVETLRNIPTAQSATWASTPETVTLPAVPSVVTDTTDIAAKAAELMNDGSVGINKVAIADRDNLLPEFSFDEGDSTYFQFTNCTPGSTSGFTSSSRSGGKAIWFQRDSNASDATVWGQPVNFTSVREGFTYAWSVEFRSHIATAHAAGFTIRIRYYDESKTYLGATGVAGNIDIPATAWTIETGTWNAPVGARYATFVLVVPSTAPAGTTVRVDNCSLKQQLFTAVLPDNVVTNSKILSINGSKLDSDSVTFGKIADVTAGRILGRPVGAGTGDINELTVAQTLEILGNSTSYGDVGTYALLRGLADADFLPNSDYAGSGLRPAGAAGPTGGTAGSLAIESNGSAPLGTWKCMGRIAASATQVGFTLFVRIS